MGVGGKDTDEYGRDGARTVNDVQGVGSESATLQEQELGFEGGYSEGAGGVPPSSVPEDSRYISP